MILRHDYLLNPFTYSPFHPHLPIHFFSFRTPHSQFNKSNSPLHLLTHLPYFALRIQNSTFAKTF